MINTSIKKNFSQKKNLGKRNWGREDLLVLIPKVLTLKKLFIKKGNKRRFTIS